MDTILIISMFWGKCTLLMEARCWVLGFLIDLWIFQHDLSMLNKNTIHASALKTRIYNFEIGFTTFLQSYLQAAA